MEVIQNARQCGICGAPADRHPNHFECQANPAHMGDLIVGIFSDCSRPEEPAPPQPFIAEVAECA